LNNTIKIRQEDLTLEHIIALSANSKSIKMALMKAPSTLTDVEVLAMVIIVLTKHFEETLQAIEEI